MAAFAAGMNAALVATTNTLLFNNVISNSHILSMRIRQTNASFV
jgi:hypothetical protein